MFPKFPSIIRVIDMSDRNPPITATSVTFYVMLAGCVWWILIRNVDNTYDWRKFWKRFRECFVFQSRVSTKTVVRSHIQTESRSWFPLFIDEFERKFLKTSTTSSVSSFRCWLAAYVPRNELLLPIFFLLTELKKDLLPAYLTQSNLIFTGSEVWSCLFSTDHFHQDHSEAHICQGKPFSLRGHGRSRMRILLLRSKLIVII